MQDTPIQITVVVGDNYVEQLEKRLTKENISHGALARAAGMHKTQISRMFRLKATPRRENIARLEKAVLIILTERKQAKKHA